MLAPWLCVLWSEKLKISKKKVGKINVPKLTDFENQLKKQLEAF